MRRRRHHHDEYTSITDGIEVINIQELPRNNAAKTSLTEEDKANIGGPSALNTSFDEESGLHPEEEDANNIEVDSEFLNTEEDEDDDDDYEELGEGRHGFIDETRMDLRPSSVKLMR